MVKGTENVYPEREKTSVNMNGLQISHVKKKNNLFCVIPEEYWNQCT